MMYSNKLAVAIKANNKVLREFGEKVYVPFGTEYKILIKNLNTVKAIVNVTIDGTKATECALIIDAGKEVDFERFLKKDLNKGNKFKFIERTSAIEKHKGVGLEDGLVNIEFQFEQIVQPNPSFVLCDFSRPFQRNYPFPISGGLQPNMVISTNNTSTTSVVLGDTRSLMDYDMERTTIRNDSAISTNSVNLNSSARTKSLNFKSAIPQNENGITVPGSISEQKFIPATIGQLENIKHNMIIKLVGETEDNQPVVKPVTVDIKPICVTCGRKNKATNQFCGSCGSSLQIVC